MKRIKGMNLLFLISVLLLTGCSASKLKCEIKTNNYTAKVVVKYSDDNKPTKYKFNDKMLFSATSSNAEIYYHSKYAEYGTLIAEKFAHMRNTPEYVQLKIKYDFTKNNSAQENKLLINKTDSKENAKQKLENLGYKCK